MSKAPTHLAACLRVYVVDDDPDVRDALGLLLKLRGHKVSVFDCAEALLDELPADASGCLVTDIRMPGMDGLALQQELAERAPHLPVVVLTAHGDIESARAALKAQAIDFLLKPFEEKDLLAAIETAFERERVRLDEHKRVCADRTMLDALTAREREVAALLATGAPNLEIANQLGISPRTVEIHKARCMEKLKARSIADVVRFVDRTGLGEPG
jgi:FixJ family two-component response regulator